MDIDTQEEPVEASNELEAAYEEVMAAEEEDSTELDAQDDGLESESSEELTAPEHWAEEDRELFASKDRDVQEYILERSKSMEGDYTRKSQARASDIKLAESLHEYLEPYRPDFESQGVDEAGAIKALLEVHGQLKTDPATALMQLAQQYNYNPETNYPSDSYQTESDSEYFEDPDDSSVKQELAQLRNELNKTQQAQQNSAQQGFASSLNQFVNAKDESGNDAHPLAGEVRNDITRYMQARVAQNFEQAYNMAIAARPELRESLTQQQSEAAKQKEKEEKAKSVSKAKKAAKGVKSSTSTVQKGKPQDLSQMIHQAFDEVASKS